MTTFIPSITLPAVVFASPYASILLPIACGTAVGFSVRRTHTPIFNFQVYLSCSISTPQSPSQLIPLLHSQRNPKDLHGTKATSLPPTAICLRPRLDCPLRPDGLRSLSRLQHRHEPHGLHREAPLDQTRRNTLYNPTWTQLDLDASVLRR